MLCEISSSLLDFVYLLDLKPQLWKISSTLFSSEKEDQRIRNLAWQ